MLVGVRISAFVTSDDKKPAQKSIISFLQPGKTDLSDASQGRRLEKEQLCDNPPQTWPESCLPLQQKSQREEEAPRWSRQRQEEGKQTGDPPQQSFFQRAQARRLQLQAASESSQEDGRSHNAPSITSTSTLSQKPVEASVQVPESDCRASNSSGNEAQPSTSGLGSVSESLTCPVCFRQVETTDLNLFNRHIDQCLSGASRTNISDGESSSDLEIGHRECKFGDRPRWGREAEEETGKNSESHSSTADVWRGFNSDTAQKALLINGDGKTVTSPQPQPSIDKSAVLICPICQLSQDSDDLVAFNHHVDLCLNQTLLHELRGQTASPLNPPPVTSSRAAGEFKQYCNTHIHKCC